MRPAIRSRHPQPEQINNLGATVSTNTAQTDESSTGMNPPSVDAAEVARYNALAATWWNASGPFWPLHKLNALRAPFIVEHLCRQFDRDPDEPEPLRDLRLLDIGCGGGILSETLARRGADVTGIDVAEKNIGIAKTHAREAGLRINYIHTPVETLKAEPFDAVLNMEVVEHVADLPQFMTACSAQVRKDRGLMFVATINRTLLSYLVAIVGAEYILRWLPRGTHQWRRFVRPLELEELLTRDGLQVQQAVGVSVNPLTRRYSIIDKTPVNYMLVAGPLS